MMAEPSGGALSWKPIVIIVLIKTIRLQFAAKLPSRSLTKDSLNVVRNLAGDTVTYDASLSSAMLSSVVA